MNRKIGILLILFISFLVFAGCSKKETDNQKGKNSQKENDNAIFEIDPNVEGEIVYWTRSANIFEELVEEFNKEYPNIKVNVVVLGGGELEDKLQTTLAAGSGAPDLAQVGVNSLHRFTTEGLLEDLLQPPYDAGRFQQYVTDYDWNRWKSLDGKRQLALPWDVTTGVFYYRQDIYEQMGLPSEPEELGEYLQDTENFMNAAKTLAANDIYMYDWRDLPAVQYGDSVGYFDTDYNWVRNDDKMAELLDVVKQGIQVGWAPQLSGLWSDEGKALMKQGKIASLSLDSWGARDIKIVLPEQEGKWRVTKRPLGYTNGGGTSFVIPAQSQQKDAAWAFMQWMTLSEASWKILLEHAVQPTFTHITSLPWYEEFTNEYLGGQQEFKLYSSLAETIPVRRYTALDGPAWNIYIDGLNKAIENNIDSKTALSQIESNVLKELATEIEELKAAEGK